jgi:hypothetical protein
MVKVIFSASERRIARAGVLPNEKGSTRACFDDGRRGWRDQGLMAMWTTAVAVAEPFIDLGDLRTSG